MNLPPQPAIGQVQAPDPESFAPRFVACFAAIFRGADVRPALAFGAAVFAGFDAVGVDVMVGVGVLDGVGAVRPDRDTGRSRSISFARSDRSAAAAVCDRVGVECWPSDIAGVVAPLNGKAPAVPAATTLIVSAAADGTVSRPTLRDGALRCEPAARAALRVEGASAADWADPEVVGAEGAPTRWRPTARLTGPILF